MNQKTKNEMKNNYEEYSLAKIKKENAEYLTPKPIIELIHNEIGEGWKDKIVIDICCGSGGLSYGLKCQKIYGVEFNSDASKVAEKNGLEVWTGDYFDFDNSWNYDCVLSNPPFSLKRQEKHMSIYRKWNQKSGVLDPYFVVESFSRANFEGYYVLFCGLLYRRQEKWFRKWLVDNNYIDKIWMTKPNLFTETTIAVIVLKLKHNRQTSKVKTIDADGYEGEIDIKDWIDDDYTIRIVEPPKTEEQIDIVELEKQVEIEHQKYLEYHRKFNEAVKEVKKYLGEENEK